MVRVNQVRPLGRRPSVKTCQMEACIATEGEDIIAVSEQQMLLGRSQDGCAPKAMLAFNPTKRLC